MRQLVEASYVNETKTCHFSLLIDGETHLFSAEVTTERIEGEDWELKVLHYKPDLSQIIALSDRAHRVLGVSLLIIASTGKKLELPVDLDAGGPGLEALFDRAG